MSREPVKKGPRFCSPACGAGCTWDAYSKARRSAAKLARELGKGWKPDVWEWECLGWHWQVVKDGLKISAWTVNGVKGYTASLGEPGSPGGRWSKYGESPRAAIENVIAEATKDRDFINACIEAAGVSR